MVFELLVQIQLEDGMVSMYLGRRRRRRKRLKWEQASVTSLRSFGE
jgi:hypothetical protein